MASWAKIFKTPVSGFGRCWTGWRNYHAVIPASSELPSPRLDYKDISARVTYKVTNALNRKAQISFNDVQAVARAYSEHKAVSSSLNSKRNERSVLGEKVRQAAQDKDPESKEAALAKGKALKEEIAQLEARLTILDEQLLSMALSIPNDTHPQSPLGPESSAVVLSTHGPEPLPASEARDHLSIAKQFNLLDLEKGASVTGSSWYYLTNEGALLEMALSNYAMSVALKRGFTPIITPDVVRSDIARRCGFQPRDADPPLTHLYHIEAASPSHPQLILSGTAEIPLAGMFANQVIPSPQLPRKLVGIGKAYRAEAGSRGADTRGLFRVHQFTKVELFAVTTAADSEQMMEELRAVQTSILDGLQIPFRVIDMPSEELGASAYRKYDMEAWMPGRGRWGEVASLSNCTDYQARRLLIRQTSPKTHPALDSLRTSNPFVHTLNGTAAAIPRLIVALLENGAVLDDEGHVTALTLPSALRPFWIGAENPERPIRWD